MILMNDFKKEYRVLKPEIDKDVIKVFESGWFILGKKLKMFEEKFAKYTGTKYCIGVANGLEALQISLMALGVGKGDEVITVANTAVATVLAISNTGAKPVFVDVNEYYLMDAAKIKEKITKNTKVILPVHLFGQIADMEKITKIAEKYNLKIIEDACQAHGAKQNNQKAGSFGDLNAFSFYPTKNLGAYGDGGAITTDSKKLYEKCLMLRNYGQINRYHHEIRGLNSRLDEVQAAILGVKLKHLDSFVEKRNNIASLYIKELYDIKQIKLPKTMKNNYHAFHLFAIKTRDREKLMEYLTANGIQTLIHYPLPVHKQNCYRQYNSISLPITEENSRNILSLPIHPFMEEKEIKTICLLIRRFYENN